MATITDYLQLAVDRRASDIHFSSGEPVRYRIDGDLIVLDHAQLETAYLQELLLSMLENEERDRLLANNNLDKSIVMPGVGNFRLNIFFTRRGIAAVLRTIPWKIPTIEELGLPPVVKELTSLNKGLVLVTGPTGSGKSTTLAAMINHINENYPCHILTAEDPVEFVHPSKKSLINQREIGNSCPSFSDALKYALREDPDVILVGEMRDLETISLALTAAETGHLVFGTLHTRGAAPSIDRVIDSFPANQQSMIRTMLSDVLAAVISQTLLKRADGEGRVAAFEIMVVNHAISNLIREGKTFQIPSVLQTARKEGMILMDHHIRELIRQKIVTVAEAVNYLEDASGLMVTQPKVAAVEKAAAPVALAASPAAAPPMRSPAPAAAPAGGKPAPTARPSQSVPRSVPPQGAPVRGGELTSSFNAREDITEIRPIPKPTAPAPSRVPAVPTAKKSAAPAPNRPAPAAPPVASAPLTIEDEVLNDAGIEILAEHGIEGIADFSLAEVTATEIETPQPAREAPSIKPLTFPARPAPGAKPPSIPPPPAPGLKPRSTMPPPAPILPKKKVS